MPFTFLNILTERIIFIPVIILISHLHRKSRDLFSVIRIQYAMKRKTSVVSLQVDYSVDVEITQTSGSCMYGSSSMVFGFQLIKLTDSMIEVLLVKLVDAQMSPPLDPILSQLNPVHSPDLF
jgi:hypothetical protein